MESIVQPLKRLRTAVEVGNVAADFASSNSEVVFIYGIGSSGVSPFECLLADKQEGDTISFHLGKAEADHFFGHHQALFRPLFGNRHDAFFRIRIAGIETPEPREVVRAMAETLSHGHGEGCECGCGCS
jgi:hypothetical protein